MSSSPIAAPSRRDLANAPSKGATSSRPIDMVDLGAQHADVSAEILGRFETILRDGRFILGETVREFESALADRCQTGFALSCNSGTDALWLALRALGIGEGDAVLCPAFSFFASAASIARTGAVPIFIDIDPVTLNLDPTDAIRRAEATPNLRAILSVDLFGRIAELGPLADYARANQIRIVEDAAQSIDALDAGGQGPGYHADLACLSFYPTKNLGALGDAGAVMTRDPDLARRVEQLRVHGERANGLYEEIGINSRMDALQAAALSVKLRFLDGWTEARGAHAMRLNSIFADAGAGPEGALGLETPEAVSSPGQHAYHRYVVRVAGDRRAKLVRALDDEHIASEIYYPLGLHQQPALAPMLEHQPRLSTAGGFPETERATREVLALPLYPELAVEDIERIADCVIRALTR